MTEGHQLRLPFHDGNRKIVEVDIGPPPVNDACVHFLETLLEQARSGELTGICAAAQFTDGSVGTLVSDSMVDRYFESLGAIESLKDFLKEREKKR